MISSRLLKGSGLDNHWDRLSLLEKPLPCYFLFHKKEKAQSKERGGRFTKRSWAPSKVLLLIGSLIVHTRLAKSYSLVSMLGMKRGGNSEEVMSSERMKQQSIASVLLWGRKWEEGDSVSSRSTTLKTRQEPEGQARCWTQVSWGLEEPSEGGDFRTVFYSLWSSILRIYREVSLQCRFLWPTQV